MNYMPSWQSGFTLFELLLVLVIGGALVLSSLQAYHSLRTERQIAKAKQSVQALLLASAVHFTDKPSVDALLAEKNVNPKVLKNNLIAHFTLSYQEHPARIICVATPARLVNAKQLEQLAKALGAQVREGGQQLEWQTTPSAVMQPVSSFWMLQANLEGFVKRVAVHEVSA